MSDLLAAIAVLIGAPLTIGALWWWITGTWIPPIHYEKFKAASDRAMEKRLAKRKNGQR